MKHKLLILLLLPILIGISSCDVEEILNPNDPTVESFEKGATLADLKLLANGLIAVIREDVQFHYWTLSMLGREYYDLRGTDPRYTGELLGQNGSDLDNNGFLTTRTYFGRYRSVRNANLLKTAVANTVASLTQEETNSFLGFANTIMGYELLMEANRQYENGLRLDVADPDNLGPFAGSYQETLSGILAILDEGNAQLRSASDEFLFNLVGFSSIPGTETEAVAKFNRALAARIELYRGNNSAVLSALNGSFFDIDGDINIGAYYSFGGATGNDLTNPFFYVPGVDNYLAHPSWINDATAGDNRLSKATETGLIEFDGLSGTHQVTLYASNSSEAIILRNEELILIYAEANVGTNNAEAVNAINVVRNTAGIGDYTGGTSDAELINEILYQRRYSLFGEAHRWIDARRYNRLDELPLDRNLDKVHVQFPRPANEVGG